MPQSDFQRRAFAIAQQAHSAADRADARILMRMVEVVDERDYAALPQLCQALQSKYRDELGGVPDSEAGDKPADLDPGGQDIGGQDAGGQDAGE